MGTFLDEQQAELELIDLVRELGYEYAYGPDLAPDGAHPERASYAEVVLFERLTEAVRRLNPALPAEAVEEAVRKVRRADSPSPVQNNRAFHRMLIDGAAVEQAGEAGRTIHESARLIDFEQLDANDWLVVNQFTVKEGRHTRRPDVVVFVNGLPLVVAEMKNPSDEQATLKQAYNQIQTYKEQVPTLFNYNELLLISDGIEARAGTLTGDYERFMPWRTIDGRVLAPPEQPPMDVLVAGMLEPQRLLDLIRYFVVFEDDGQAVSKKLAAYHQYHAVNKAVDCTLEASAPEGDKRVGVVWHTQGSGKSLSMAFYAGKIILHPRMENPTLVALTDRNDLDDQLYGTFAGCQELLRQKPERAETRADLRDKLQRAGGGVVFTTIQKFMPETKGDTYPQLSDRRNIVVIADEAHRSQYGFIDGLARHTREALPNASWIAFTGTPIEQEDKSTRAVFGEYIDIYDVQDAVDDGATVRIYYEARLAKIELKEEEKPRIDPQFEEVTEGVEDQLKGKLKTKWARMEQLVGTDKRLGLIAEDLVNHFEDREAAMPGKGMIVCMSRRICVDLYEAITRLRPDWHGGDDEKGAIKVVMTGSASDPANYQPHIRPKKARDDLAKRFKDPSDPLKLVIVRDMWLTGFDCPALHTMYLDKPMQGHTLMQAIARVNRVFKDKPGGLVVDYLGLADQLRKALADYTASGGKGAATVKQEDAVAVMLEKYEIVQGMVEGFDYREILGRPKAQFRQGIVEAMNHILGLEDGKSRFLQHVTELSKAFALAVPHEQALAIRDEVGFFQAVRSALAKREPGDGAGKSEEQLESAIRQIVSRSVVSDEVVDIFSAAGLKRPEISILSDEFLQEVQHLPQRNVAVELLQRLLGDEIKTRQRKNVVQARSFAEMLEEAIRKYQNRSIEAAQVIEELLQLARDMRDAKRRQEAMGLDEDEAAFYDALVDHEGVQDVMGDDTLRGIAHELLKAVRKSVTIDWTVRENARAQVRVLVKRILRKHGYPPDKQEKATETVLTQAEVICGELAA